MADRAGASVRRSRQWSASRSAAFLVRFPSRSPDYRNRGNSSSSCVCTTSGADRCVTCLGRFRRVGRLDWGKRDPFERIQIQRPDPATHAALQVPTVPEDFGRSSIFTTTQNAAAGAQDGGLETVYCTVCTTPKLAQQSHTVVTVSQNKYCAKYFASCQVPPLLRELIGQSRFATIQTYDMRSRDALTRR